MEHLSGLPEEHSIECTAIPGGPSAQWDTLKGYNGKWWAASQALAPAIAQDMLTSGYMLGTESWFAAFWEDTGEPAPYPSHNLPTPPAGPTFEEFLTAVGLERSEQVL